MHLYPSQSTAFSRALSLLALVSFFNAICLAATFQVTTTADSGPGSLREAMLLANFDGMSDTITLTGKTFTDVVPDFIDLASPLPTISSEIVIVGPGADKLSIRRPANATSKFRIIDVLRGGNLHLSDLTITGGDRNGTSGSGGNQGGGIYSQFGILTLNRVNITGNGGGGIYAVEGTVSITDCLIRGNTAISNGGGIAQSGSKITMIRSSVSGNKAYRGGGISANGGTLTMIHCSVSENSTTDTYVDYSDGGAFFSTGCALTLIQSTVSENVAYHFGGGIMQSGGDLTLIQSTVSGNKAVDGGGIWVGYSAISSLYASNVTVSQSTVCGNTATGKGGGIHSYADQGTITISNSIICYNTGADYLRPNALPTLTLAGKNLVEDASISAGIHVINGDPNLGPLQDNGGPTLTHAPLAGSPVIDAGITSALPVDAYDLDGDLDVTEPIPLDQRGLGFNRVVGTAPDIGAFEWEKFLTILADSATVNEGNSGGTSLTFTISRIGGTAGSVDVTYRVGGAAVSAADFGGVFPTGTISMADGATSTTVTIPVSGDLQVEADETFTVNLSAPTDGYVVYGIGARGSATIIDNDTATVSIAKIRDGVEPGTDALFRVTQTAEASVDSVVSYTVGGTATSGADFTALSGSVRIPAGQTTADISVAVLNENIVEPTETAFLTLTGFSAGDPEVTLGASLSASSNITDSDTSVITLAAVSANKAEGTGGANTAFTFGTTLSNPVAGGFTIAYRTNDGTALAPVDYRSDVSKLHFSGTAGEIQMITVYVIHDGTEEPDETFTVSLEAITGTTLGDSLSTTGSPQVGTIRDDDALTVSISATDANADENSAGTGTYRLTRNNVVGTTTVQLAIDASSTAVAADWTQAGATFASLEPGGMGTITIPAGAAFVDITLAPSTDIHAEGAETVSLNILPDAAYRVGSPANATITIAANDFVVTNTNNAGEGSLRQAMLNSNNLAGAETITFEGDLFTDATVPDTIDLTSMLPSFGGQTTIAGPGDDKLVIRRPAATASFGLMQLFAGSDVTLSGLTLSGGKGGIANLGNLRVDRCTISGNSDSTYGGILNNGTLVVTNSTISGNTSTSGVGGGIYNLGRRTLSVFNSTISGNSSKNGGGGISIVSGSTVLIANSTVSGNTAGSSGAGVLNGGALTVVNSTITGNRGTGQGGGIATSIGSSLTLANSIVAGNTASSGPDINTYSSSNLISSNGANFIGNSTGAAGVKSTDKTFASTGTTLSQLLGPLADNDGLTLTHALVEGSPAINGGANASIPIDTIDLDGDSNTKEPVPYDQRGGGFVRVIGAKVDIGAFEAFAFEPTITAATTDEDVKSSAGLVITANPADDGLTTHYKITGILNGTLYRNDGFTVIAAGSFITKAQGATGLKFLPAANLNSLNTASFGFSAQAATNAGLRGTTQAVAISVNSINDAPTIVAPGLMDQTMEVGSDLSVSLPSQFADPDGDVLGFSVLANSNSSGASATIIGTDVALNGLANGVTNITILADDGLGGTISDTFMVSVGTAEPTPLQIGTTGTLIRQNGLFELTVNVTNTTPLPINGFRLHVDFSTYLAAYSSLRLYNATSPAGATDVYVDYPYPVPLDGVVPLKLSFYTSTRTFPSPFSPVLTVETLASSQVPGTDDSGVQPRIAPLPDRTILLEFPSVAGRWYRVRYCSDLQNWSDSPVPIQASTNRMQWIDSGPPFTDVSPAETNSRYYRVNEIAAP